MAKCKSIGAVRLRGLNGSLQEADAEAREAIARAWSLRFSDPQEMVAWARLAVELAQATDTRARAHMHLGNACRICGDFEEAGYHLDIAGSLLSDPDPLLLEFRASLLENLSQFEEAIDCLRAAGRLRAASRDRDGEAKILASTGHVLTEAGRHSEAVHMFRSAIETVKSDKEVAQAAAHGLAHALARSGQPRRALAVIEEARPLFQDCEAVTFLRLEWLLGRIAMVVGDDQQAVTSLDTARKGFEAAGLVHEVCVTTLDLALTHARAGRLTQAQGLLAPVPQLLSSLGVRAEAEVATAVQLLLLGEESQAVELLDLAIQTLECGY
jgi:tetratricopeptide (TPR) repeat protein